MWDVFEQPWTLLGAAVIVLLGVLTFRSVWADRRRWWQWLLPAGLAMLALGLDRAVTTDLEKIHRLLTTSMRAVEQENCGAIAAVIADDYADSVHTSKQALLSRCRARLVPPAVERVKKLAMATRITPPEATVTLTLQVRLEQESYWVRSYGKQAALVKVQLTLRKQPDASWRITRIEVLEVDTVPTNWGVVKGPSEHLPPLVRPLA